MNHTQHPGSGRLIALPTHNDRIEWLVDMAELFIDRNQYVGIKCMAQARSLCKQIGMDPTTKESLERISGKYLIRYLM
jgi:hypothetical protein